MAILKEVISPVENLVNEQKNIKFPGLFQVILRNDDYTPMDFVVHVLQRFFALELSQAELITWQIHTQGKGVCGTYTKDIAETKAKQVNTYARQQEHPLLCDIESA